MFSVVSLLTPLSKVDSLTWIENPEYFQKIYSLYLLPKHAQRITESTRTAGFRSSEQDGGATNGKRNSPNLRGAISERCSVWAEGVAAGCRNGRE